MSDQTKKLAIRKLTTYEQKRLEEKKRQNKENQIKEQIIQGKKYQGKGFDISEKIEFLDFEVGKVYEKSLKLINISWSFNSFKILTLDKDFRNNFEIECAPPGRVSAGIDVPLKIIFFPQSRINIDTELPLQCETGKITIPITCRYKKTEARLSQQILDFGITTIGEEKIKKIYLENFGGLASDFEVQNFKGKKIEQSNITMSAISSQSELSDSDSEIEQNFSQDYGVDFDFFSRNLKIDIQKSLKEYSKNVLTLTYTPHKLQKFRTILIFKFSNFIDQKELKLEIKGESQEVPITSLKNVYDFDICLYNQLYRQKLVFKNTSKKTSKIKIEAPFESEEFFQFNPKFSYIQGESTTQIWLKAILTEKMKRYLENYFDGDVLTLPVKLSCSEQKIPVSFDIKMELSSSELSFNQNIDFEILFENTSSVKKLPFVNKSLLPQKILFYRFPNNIQIIDAPNPFIALPNQITEISIMYQGVKIGQDQGKIQLKIIVGKELTKEMFIEYKADVKKCPLKFSALQLEFPISQPGEIHNYFLLVQNITQQKYIIEFQKPDFELSGIQVDIKVMDIEKEQTKKFPIQYFAEFRNFDLKQKMEDDLKENPQINELFSQLETLNKQIINLEEEKANSKNKKDVIQKLNDKQDFIKEQIELCKQKIENTKKVIFKAYDKQQFLQQKGGRITDFTDNQIQYQLAKWMIPILFKEKLKPDTTIQKIFIQIETLVRTPILKLKQKILDFGTIPLGHKKVLQFDIESKCDQTQDLKMDLLEYSSGFNLLNILQPLQSMQQASYKIRFEPEEARDYCESLRIFDKYAITLILKGRAVYPKLEIKDQLDFLDMGNLFIGQQSKKSFTLINNQEFDVMFKIKVFKQGIDNEDESDVFEISPIQNFVKANDQQTIDVYFNPKKIGIHYFIQILIDVEKIQEQKFFFLKGCAFKNQGFFFPYIKYDKEGIKNILQTKISSEEKFFKNFFDVNQIFTTFEINQEESKYQKQFLIGCVASDDPKSKSIEYEIFMDQNNYTKFFHVDLPKGKLNSGDTQIITVTYSPQKKNYKELQNLKNIKRILIQNFSVFFKGEINYKNEPLGNRKISCEIKFEIWDLAQLIFTKFSNMNLMSKKLVVYISREL